jgi:cold shock CspA family protein
MGSGKDVAQKSYFAQKGIRISIENLHGFTQALESIFVDHEFTSKTIGQLSNYNIRKTLLLSKRVLTSSVIKIEDLVRSYISGKPITTSFSRFIDALLRGNYSLYKRNDDSEIIPIFDVDQRVRQSPLLNVRILSLLAQIYNNGKDVEEKHVNLESIISYFEAIGGNEVSTIAAITKLLESKLIEPYDVSSPSLSNETDLAISHKGLIHLQLALKNAVFFYQMSLITDIADETAAQKIKQAYKLPEFYERIAIVKKEFSQFLLSEDSKYFSQNSSTPNYDCQLDIIREINKFCDDSKKPENDLVSTLGEQFKNGLIFEETLCSVAWYDPKKRYGYANVEKLDEGVFFHLDRLLECGISYISESDKILCQVSRNNKGLQIDKIFDIEIDSNSIEKEKCIVIRLFKDRDYGFASVGDTQHIAYFPTYLFSNETRGSLEPGHEFTAEVILDSGLGSYQIRSVLSSDGIDKLV